jgi:hypothetical protein
MSSDDHRTDELLNAFIDEELTATEEAEIRHRLGQDKHLAARLDQLSACRTLVNSLPRAKVPVDLVDRVRQTLERRSLLEEVAPAKTGRLTNHLFARRLAAVAAAVSLVGVLSILVYSILTPTPTRRQSIAANDLTSGVRPKAMARLTPGAMTGRLEVRVASLAEMEMFFNRAIENGGLEVSVARDDSNRRVYRLQCSHASLDGLLAELTNVWNRFERPTFYLETGDPAGPVKVDLVTPDQLTAIAGQQDTLRSAELAKEIAVRNAAVEALAGERGAELTGQVQAPWLTVAKPVLTSSERSTAGKAESSSDPKLVDFTLILDSR